MGSASSVMANRAGSGAIYFLSNAYYDGAWKYRTTDEACYIVANENQIQFGFASSGTYDTTISWDQALTIETDLTATFGGDVYVTGNMSAESITDRTPYPDTIQTAYDAVQSMQRLPESKYDPEDKANQLDHSKLHPYLKVSDKERDLSATVSCQNEVIKDLVKRVEVLERNSQRKTYVLIALFLGLFSLQMLRRKK